MNRAIFSTSWAGVVCAACLLGSVAVGAYTRTTTFTDAGEVTVPASAEPTQAELELLAQQDPEAGPIAPAPLPAVEPPAEERRNALQVPAELPRRGLRKPWYTPLTEDGFLSIGLSAIDPDYVGVWPAETATVLLSRNGTVMHAAKVGPGGIAQVPAVGAGAQAVLAFGLEGVAAFGIFVSNTPGPFVPPHPPVIDMALVPLIDAELAHQLLAARSGPSPRLGAVVPVEAITGKYGVRRPVFHLRQDGSFSGRLIVPGEEVARALPDARVFLIRDGSLLAEGRTDANGIFEVPDAGVIPGYVSMVVQSAAGFSVSAAEILDRDELVGSAAPDGTQPVAFQQDAGADVFLTPAPPDALPQFQQMLQQMQAAAAGPAAAAPGAPGFGAPGGGAFGGGPGGGFGGGGGGLGGGGGGLGLGLLGAAAGGALGWAIADSQRDRARVVTPAEP